MPPSAIERFWGVLPTPRAAAMKNRLRTERSSDQGVGDLQQERQETPDEPHTLGKDVGKREAERQRFRHQMSIVCRHHSCSDCSTLG
jgi:hypothetical protein